MSDFPQIFTFYSFKGGVGRSMAVLNVAYALVAKGRNVLVLDMDLEAPGLSGFLRRHKEIGDFAGQDMVDLVRWATGFSAASRQNAEPLDRAAFPPLSDFIVSVPREKLESMPHPCAELGRLDIVPVDEQRDYYGRLTALATGSFEQDALIRIGSILRAWLKSRRFAIEVPDYYGPAAERTAAYDYVLVDSRTGVTETGGLCIGPLSDQLVVLTALNDQNVQGTRKFLEEVGILAKQSSDATDIDTRKGEPAHRLDPKPTLIVASPVPAGEIKQKQERLKELEGAVGMAVIKLSYHPQMALLESIFTRDCRDEYLAGEYDALVREILDMASDATLPGYSKAISQKSHTSPSERRDLVAGSLRFASATGVEWPLEFLLSTFDADQLVEDEDFIGWDRFFRVLCRSEEASFLALGQWANLLSHWSLRSTDPELAVLRREVAFRSYERVLQDERASSRQKAQAHFNRGVTHGKLGDAEKAIADYTAIIEMPDAPPEQKALALSNRGWHHFVEGRYREAIEDDTQAVSLNPKSCIAQGNLAIALLVDGQADAALAAYDAALALASIENLDDMASLLERVIQTHGSLTGADQARARIEARRKSLQS
jgi:tetratricopeptide (TPR) repeat protein